MRVLLFIGLHSFVNALYLSHIRQASVSDSAPAKAKTVKLKTMTGHILMMNANAQFRFGLYVDSSSYFVS